MSKRINKFIYCVTVAIFLILTLGPIIWCFVLSVSMDFNIVRNDNNILPDSFTLDNYKKLFDSDNNFGSIFINGFSNTLKSAFLTIGIGLPVCLVTAYGFYAYDFPGKKMLKSALLFTTVIPVFATIIPLYSIYSQLNLLDNRIGLTMIYTTSVLPMISWLLINYFETLPRELVEAAYIDGGGELRVFFDIILPISLPIIMTSVLIIFLMSWSFYLIPLILTTSRETKPLSVIIGDFSSKDAVQYGLSAAAGIVAIIPPALLAIIFRKSLVSGLTKGAIK